MSQKPQQLPLLPKEHGGCELRITLDYYETLIRLQWTWTASLEASRMLTVRCTGANELTWELHPGPSLRVSTHDPKEISSCVEHYWRLFPINRARIFYGSVLVKGPPGAARPGKWTGGRLSETVAFNGLNADILAMATQLSSAKAKLEAAFEPLLGAASDAMLRRLQKEREREEDLRRRIQEGAARMEKARKEREAARRARAAAEPPALAPKAQARPSPRVPLRIEAPALELQPAMWPVSTLDGYFLQERAALWWVSNQSDDLLALPYCRIERLEYQIRTALKVIGAFRGRALLSDEVGLGKTVEAGLVLKEYLTRGMVQRFLILTTPSLVDQWEEELEEKFQIRVATTNHASFRSAGPQFWAQNSAVVGSLHTLKLDPHLAVAQTVKWDMLVIDEAHYLRNRSSQAWQAISALPRQFLLLLTATPVQNSLEELYNLVTLLQPGQLPPPAHFRKRFINAERPHEPREPEELRRLLGQVMIRNTRANAGINLPPRRAETVLFQPEPAEGQFWEMWDAALRLELAQLTPSRASMWGRLLLQAAGSSPAAWRSALKSFPSKAAARSWAQAAPLEASWRRKCESLIPLAKAARGVVIFTQFLETQAALAEFLRHADVATAAINGQTPAARRQPITEEFRQNGGALLLTHSGTEGRNLQFCHQLVNFDLPWNPMELEQRIGRLHRLGQQHTVQIYNFVQAGSLQEHLLEILHDKLNLFELVVGEAGLILGERFSSDEFAEEVFRRWRDAGGDLAQGMRSLGEQLAGARADYAQIQKLDRILFAKDYEAV